MWFWFSLAALLFWSGSDLFSKLGCADKNDRYAHLKMVTAVGVVMGVHACYTVFIAKVPLSAEAFLRYLPVSALYILSMALGYIGLRYIELSVSSPICNSSGAIVAVLAIVTGEKLALPQYLAVALVCFGVMGIGLVEMREDEELRLERQKNANYKYTKSAVAIVLPILYCLLDALGTFSDSVVLLSLDEEVANTAYELTFFAVGVVSFLYVKFVKKQKYLPRKEAPKYVGALFETAGQFAYIFALGDESHVAMAAPMISSYCLVSVLWGRIFLKEKLSVKHYLMIAVAAVGIVVLGIYDG